MLSLLNHNQFNVLFPFHLIVDKDLIIQSAGISFDKLDHTLKGQVLESRFEIFKPRFVQLRYDSLIQHIDQLLLIKLRGFEDFIFRYQLIPLDNGSLLLAGSLWVTELELLNKHKIQLSDFAKHDAITDMLQVLRSKEIVMDEIKVLIHDLEEQRLNLFQIQKQFGVVLENIPSALLVEDKDRKIIFTNNQFCDLFELPFTPEQMVGFDCKLAGESTKSFFEDEASFLPRIDDLIRTNKKEQGELLKLKNGKLIERDFIPIQIDGITTGLLWQYKDVTIAKSSELYVRQSEMKYRSMIENLKMGLMEVDLNGVVIKVYQSFCELTGYSESELIGKRAVDLLVEPSDVAMMEAESAKRLDGTTSTYEVRLKKKDGSIIWVIISGAPVTDHFNKITGSIGLHWDITGRIEKEEELKRAKEIAEKSSQAKKEFMAKMSHELRTPLNVIQGMSQLLLESKLTADQREEVESILKSGDNLTKLVSDLLDISKIESGKLTLKRHEFSIREMILDISNHFYFVAKSKGLIFNLKLFPEVPEFVQADELKIRQVISNLLSNAVKFTEQGSVNFEISYAGENFIFTVKDTGVGIPFAKQDQVFELFGQAHGNSNYQFGGTGLGLTIAKELVELMDGVISLKSSEGYGTQIKVTLPLEVIMQQSNEEKSQNKNMELSEKNSKDSLADARILIAEDNALNQSLISKILNSWQVVFDIANNGKEVIELLSRKKYDLILMDILMPEMDGIEATKQIRKLPNYEASLIPIIGLSAFSSNLEIQEGLNAGMNDFVTKPIDMQILKKSLQRWTAKEVSEFNVIRLDYFNDNGLSDRNTIADFAKIFSTNTSDMLVKINTAIDNKSLASAKMEIHSLKSNARIFGIDRLEFQLELLETNDWLSTDNLTNIKQELNFVYKQALIEINQLIQEI